MSTSPGTVVSQAVEFTGEMLSLYEGDADRCIASMVTAMTYVIAAKRPDFKPGYVYALTLSLREIPPSGEETP